MGLNPTFFSSYYQRSSVLQGPLGSTWDSYSREGRLTKQDSRYPPGIAPVVSPSCIPIPGSLERSGAQCCPLGAQVPGEYVWKGCPSRPDIQEVSQPGQGCGILRPSSIHGGDKQNIPEEKKGYYWSGSWYVVGGGGELTTICQSLIENGLRLILKCKGRVCLTLFPSPVPFFICILSA